MSAALILTVIALALACVEQLNAQGRSLLAWAVIAASSMRTSRSSALAGTTTAGKA